jgi:formylglycine-generating enzyme required for sulfatase activity
MAYACWVGKSLPTALEWEKSARGSEGFLFPWGNEEPNQNYVNAEVPPSLKGEISLTMPQNFPVGVYNTHFPSSLYGCYHLAGNVQEWCGDLPSYFSPILSPRLPIEYRVAKGGSFVSQPFLLANWLALPFPTMTRRGDLGFRCALKMEK